MPLPLSIRLFLVILLHPIAEAKKLFYEDSPIIQEVIGTQGYFQTSKKIRVVEFYSPFCSHCLKFKKTFTAVAEDAIKKYGPDNIDIYGVSCGANRAMCNKFNIEGYPAVYVIPKDAPVSQWKEISNLSGFHVRMIEKALVDAEKQATKGSLSAVTNAANSTNKAAPSNPGPGNAAKAGMLPKAGAEAALQKESALDKYKRLHKATIEKDRQENKKPLARRRPTWITAKATTIATSPTNNTASKHNSEQKIISERQALPTLTMNAHRLGTEAHAKRMEIVKKIVQGNAPNKKQAVAKVDEGIVPFKILPAAEKMIEKIPILKHFHKLSDEEELILDASLSFVESFRVSVFKRNGPLTSSEKKALKDWLHFVRIALPQEWGIHDLTNDLLANFDKITQSYVYLIETLDRHALLRNTWSKSCGEDNFTCGFWKMLHTASIGIAAHRGGIDLIHSKLLREHVEPISPLGAADALRGFMGNFFPCTRCSQHFVKRYDDCSNQRRCARLTASASTATDADWKEFAKWLWEFHNTVSVDILTQELEDENRQLEQEGADPKRERVEIEAEVEKLWPSPELCLSCFNDDGSYDEEEVYELLEETYWPGADMKIVLQRRVTMIYDDSREGDIAMHFVLLLIVLLVITLVGRMVSKSSVQEALIRAKKLGTTLKAGGKVRSG